ncbi:hypothetical protein PFBG_06076, partial [Plasmodium falciparum 7G8]
KITLCKRINGYEIIINRCINTRLHFWNGNKSVTFNLNIKQKKFSYDIQ